MLNLPLLFVFCIPAPFFSFVTPFEPDKRYYGWMTIFFKSVLNFFFPWLFLPLDFEDNQSSFDIFDKDSLGTILHRSSTSMFRLNSYNEEAGPFRRLLEGACCLQGHLHG